MPIILDYGTTVSTQCACCGDLLYSPSQNSVPGQAETCVTQNSENRPSPSHLPSAINSLVRPFPSFFHMSTSLLSETQALEEGRAQANKQGTVANLGTVGTILDWDGSSRSSGTLIWARTASRSARCRRARGDTGRVC